MAARLPAHGCPERLHCFQAKSDIAAKRSLRGQHVSRLGAALTGFGLGVVAAVLVSVSLSYAPVYELAAPAVELTLPWVRSQRIQQLAIAPVDFAMANGALELGVFEMVRTESLTQPQLVAKLAKMDAQWCAYMLHQLVRLRLLSVGGDGTFALTASSRAHLLGRTPGYQGDLFGLQTRMLKNIDVVFAHARGEVPPPSPASAAPAPAPPPRRSHVQVLTDADFDVKIAGKSAAVEFYAPWEEVATELLGKYLVAKVDATENADVTQKYKVRSSCPSRWYSRP